MRALKFITIVGIWWIGALCYADTHNVTPSIYKVTINKVELYNSTTGEWVTVGEGEMTFDIASVNAGAIVGGYVSGKAIPEGTYTKMRVTVSRHMRIKATINVSGTDYYTTSTSQTFNLGGGNQVTAVIGSSNVSLYSEGEVVTPSQSSGEHYQVNGDYFTDTQTFPSPFIVKKGITKKVIIKFNVTDSGSFYDGSSPPNWGSTPFFYPGTPSASVEVE